MHLWQKFVGHVELTFCPLLQLSLLPVFFCSIPPKRGRGGAKIGSKSSVTFQDSSSQLSSSPLPVPHSPTRILYPVGSVTCIPWDIHLVHLSLSFLPSLVAQMVKNLPANAGDPGSIPGLGRSPVEGHGNPLQYSCLENPMDRGPWWATAHGVTKSQTRLSD